MSASHTRRNATLPITDRSVKGKDFYKTSVKLTAAAFLGSACLAVSTAGIADECPATQRLDEFIAAGSCTNADKLYTYVSSDFGEAHPASMPKRIASFALWRVLGAVPPTLANIAVQIDTFNLGGTEVHNFSINPGGALLEGTYKLSYVVEITDPTRFFANVSIDADVPAIGPDVTFSKTLDNDASLANGTVATLTSVAGTPNGMDLAPVTYQKLWIYDTITVGPGGAVNSFTDSYVQAVPEPEEYVLMLAGLILIGVVARRRLGAGTSAAG